MENRRAEAGEECEQLIDGNVVSVLEYLKLLNNTASIRLESSFSRTPNIYILTVEKHTFMAC